MMVLSNFILPLSSFHVQHGQRILEFFKCRAMVFFLLLMTFSFLLAFSLFKAEIIAISEPSFDEAELNFWPVTLGV